MELDKIDKLLEAYFEGTTSLEEEAQLMDYFNNHNVADHLLQYKPIFVGLSAAGKECSSKDFILMEETSSKIIKPWWYAVAGMVVVAIGVGGFFLSQPQLSQDEREALIAFENSKTTMMLLSQKLNKGTYQLTYVNQFDIAKDKVWKDTSE